MRKLFIDIETSPHLAYVWGLQGEYIGINQIVAPTRVICTAFKFDNGPMQFVSEWGDGRDAMVSTLHEALDEADAVVHYNGASFDEKHLNREFVQAGFTPPSNYATIDLYRVIKHKFRFASSKLAQVSKELDIRDGKIKTDFELWSRVLDGQTKAQREMTRYNKEDVALLVDLYDMVLPWIEKHPNVALYENDSRRRCTRCASDSLIKRGFVRTGAGKFQRYQCNNCGGFSRDYSRIETTPLRES